MGAALAGCREECREVAMKLVELLQVCLDAEWQRQRAATSQSAAPPSFDWSGPRLANFCTLAVLSPDCLGIGPASGAARRDLAARASRLLTSPVWSAAGSRLVAEAAGSKPMLPGAVSGQVQAIVAAWLGRQGDGELMLDLMTGSSFIQGISGGV